MGPNHFQSVRILELAFPKHPLEAPAFNTIRRPNPSTSLPSIKSRCILFSLEIGPIGSGSTSHMPKLGRFSLVICHRFVTMERRLNTSTLSRGLRGNPPESISLGSPKLQHQRCD